MHTLRWLAGGLLAAALLSTGCGEGSAPPSRFNTRLGDSDAGTPFGAAGIDVGILQDQTAYTPTAVPQAGGGSEGGGSVSAGSGDVQAEVLALLDGLVKAALEGDVDTLLSAFNDEQVAELTKDTSALHDTYEKVNQLCRVIGTKIGQDSTNLKSLITAMGVPDGTLTAANFFEVSAVDSENATFKPKLPAGMPGSMMGLPGLPSPEGGPPEIPSVPLKKTPDGWKIQLPTAITAEQVAEMQTGLKKMQQLLDKLTDQVEKSEAKSLPELLPIFMTAMAELQAEAAAASGETPPGGGAPPDDTGAEAPSSGIVGPDGQPINPRAAAPPPPPENENENANDNSGGNENEDQPENQNENDNDGG